MDDRHQLERYFGPAQRVYGASPFGPQLERAARLHRDSEGHIVDTRRTKMVYRELHGSSQDGSPRYAQVLTPWPYLAVKRELHQASGVEPEDRDQDLQLIARMTRRLAKLSHLHQRILEVLYGDLGCRWAQQPQGRIWALVPPTKPAQRVLGRDRQQRTQEHLSPAERLAVLAAVRPRPTWVDSALDQAETWQRLAEKSWLATFEED